MNKTILLSSFLFLSFFSHVHAATVVVNPGDDLQMAIDSAVSGDTIEIKAGNYDLNNQININKQLVVKGEDDGVVVVSGMNLVDPSVFNITGNNVSLRNLNITGPNSKANGIGATAVSGLVLDNVLVEGFYYGIVLTSVSDSNLSNLNIQNSHQNAVSLVDCNNISLNTLVTQNNMNAAVGIYTLNSTSSGIIISGLNASEKNPVFAEKGNATDVSNPYDITSVNISGMGYYGYNKMVFGIKNTYFYDADPENLYTFLSTKGSVSDIVIRNSLGQIVVTKLQSLQNTINNAVSGETLIVGEYVYRENIILPRPVTLKGFSPLSVIDGNNLGTTITVSSDDVTLDGLTITGGTGTFGAAGVSSVISNNNLTMKNNNIKNNNIGVLFECTNCTVTGNTFDGNSFSVSSTGASGAVVQKNIFENSGSFAADVSGASFDFTKNWWGNATGPTNTGNASGTGEVATGTLVFLPWCLTSACTTFYVLPTTGTGATSSATTTATTTIPTTSTAPVVSGGGGGGGGGSYIPAVQTVATTTTTLVKTTATATTTAANTGVKPIGLVLGASTFNFKKNLRLGNSNSDVKELQKVLASGKFLQVDYFTNYFGKMTEKALKKWQEKNGLPATGYFGPMSRAILNK